MTKYKTFNEVKQGDTLYEVEISNTHIKFKTAVVREFDEYYSNDDILVMYINESPIMFDFCRNQTSWMNTVFTTKKEAIESAKKQIKNKINGFTNQIEYFSNKLANIDDIEFRQD